MNFLIKSNLLILLIICKNVRSGISCFVSNNPCYCELYGIKYECSTDETVIHEHLYPSVPIKDELKLSDLVYRNFPNIPPLPVLRKYKNLTNLNIFYLKGTKLDQFVFDGLNNLTELAIRYTNITIIEANAFYDLPKLEELDLRYNKIIGFPNGTFVHLNKLKKIDLRGNPLKKFQQHIFGINLNNFLRKENAYFLDTANMECDCDYLWVIEFGKKTNSTYISVFLRYDKCWLAWQKQGILELNEEQRCNKLLETSSPTQPTITGKATPVPNVTTTLISPTATPVTSTTLNYRSLVVPFLNNTAGKKISINIPSMNNFFIFNYVKSKKVDLNKVHVDYKKN